MLLLNTVRWGERFGKAAGNVHHHHHHYYMETNVHRLFVDLCSTPTILNIVVGMTAGRSSVCQLIHQCWNKEATKSVKRWTLPQRSTSALESTPKDLSKSKNALFSPVSHLQEGPPIHVWSCIRFLPVKGSLFLLLMLPWGVRFWASVKCLETIWLHQMLCK